ncbi:MAG: hypothetical protein R2911_04490 [Caldilineaceae bacterium]
MSFSIRTQIREILADDRAKAALERHIPGATTHPQLHMALYMSLGEVATYPESGLTTDKLHALLADLAAISID